MAETTIATPQPTMASATQANGHIPQQKPEREPNRNEIYARPAPARTFPLPTFYPNNPLSLLHVVYAWLGQIFRPPPAEPSVTYNATWSAATGSVHVTDDKSVRALWEQGFYGKGSLSRSEPNWLKREKVRKGVEAQDVIELVTVQRREERLRAKWERARLEQELIQYTRQKEATEASQKDTVLEPVAPVGPSELLALPNSAKDLARVLTKAGQDLDAAALNNEPGYFTVEQLLSQTPVGGVNGHIIPGLHNFTSQKSVRFSPKVESTTFDTSDPPSPGHKGKADKAPTESITIVNKEHLQLMPEEALWLKFGLGVLDVTDPASGSTLSSKELLTLFRQYSYFPPHTGPDDPDMGPDDSFLMNYAVYHHFRSLGWVPRGGIKFGVDWLLYVRGPVFDHAEFGLLVLPSYSDPWWKARGKQTPKKSWHWLHCALRALTNVYKSLVLVYVDIPPPPAFEKSLQVGFSEVLKQYKVREIMVKRWSSNRNR